MVAVDNQRVYWTDPASDAVWSAPVLGGDNTMMASILDPQDIEVDSDAVYVTGSRPRSGSRSRAARLRCSCPSGPRARDRRDARVRGRGRRAAPEGAKDGGRRGRALQDRPLSHRHRREQSIRVLNTALHLRDAAPDSEVTPQKAGLAQNGCSLDAQGGGERGAVVDAIEEQEAPDRGKAPRAGDDLARRRRRRRPGPGSAPGGGQPGLALEHDDPEPPDEADTRRSRPARRAPGDRSPRRCG